MINDKNENKDIHWTIKSFLENINPKYKSPAEQLISWAERKNLLVPQPRKGEIWTGFQFIIPITPKPITPKPIKLFKLDVKGHIQFYPGYSGYFLKEPPFDFIEKQEEFTKKLNKIGIKI